MIVRIWDLPPSLLCRQHLLGEHRELHALWRILTDERRGYALHPETRRWRGKQAALYQRHEALATEMARRGYRHASPLDPALATGSPIQTEFVDPPARQREILRAKGCDCAVSDAGQ
jgi:pyrimidine dimer DNA glycosylase